jgi:hypothetical protein
MMRCGAIGGMISRGIQSSQRNPAPMPLCPPQIPHDLIGARIRDTEMENRRLTDRATAQPSILTYCIVFPTHVYRPISGVILGLDCSTITAFMDGKIILFKLVSFTNGFQEDHLFFFKN